MYDQSWPARPVRPRRKDGESINSDVCVADQQTRLSPRSARTSSTKVKERLIRAIVVKKIKKRHIRARRSWSATSLLKSEISAAHRIRKYIPQRAALLKPPRKRQEIIKERSRRAWSPLPATHCAAVIKLGPGIL